MILRSDGNFARRPRRGVAYHRSDALVDDIAVLRTAASIGDVGHCSIEQDARYPIDALENVSLITRNAFDAWACSTLLYANDSG